VLFCPGPVRDDPALGREVNDRLVDWAEQVGIYPGRLDRLRAYDFGRLIMLAHPATSDPDRLLAAAKCVLAEWAADDYIVDEVSLGADPATVGSRLAVLYAVVDPARLPARAAPALEGHRQAEPIAAAFRSAMEHLARYTSAAQLGRFQHQMAILFLAWNQEADWHRNRRTPPVWEYLVQRHLNSYLPPMILVDVVAGYELPAREFFDPPVRRAFTTAGLANVLLNDLHSGAQESDTDFNLPRVVAAEDRCTPREAVAATVRIHNELIWVSVPGRSGTWCRAWPEKTRSNRPSASLVTSIRFRCSYRMLPAGRCWAAWASMGAETFALSQSLNAESRPSQPRPPSRSSPAAGRPPPPGRPGLLPPPARPAANSAEHQPPFRPDAPKPAISCSTTATRTDGSAPAR